MAGSEDTATGSRSLGVDRTGEHWRDRLRRFSKSDFVRSFPYWFIPFSIMGLGVYGGIGWNTIISLTDYEGFPEGGPDFSQLDLDMYFEAVQDPAVIVTTKNTFVLMVAFTTITMILGLFLAVLLDRDIRFKEKIQTVYLLPMALSFVVTAQFWLWMYDVDGGLVNTVLGVVGLDQNWIGNPDLVLGAVIFALIWQFSGYAMVVFLAGLRSLPDDQFEAARVDGASTFRTYWHVIIPQLKSSSVSAAVILMIFALKAFTFLYSMFGQYRVPQATDILATLMVREAFQLQNWAYAAAIASILLVMSLAIIAPYLYYQYRQGSL